MKGKARYFQVFALVTLLQPLMAKAHPFHWASESIGFVGGLIHPLTGADHLLIMLAVGLWASQSRRLGRMLMPWAFAFSMLMGCGLTLVPVEIAYAEPILYLAVSALALALIFVRKIPAHFAVLLPSGVALLHGYLHAYDMWLDADAFIYTLGFALTTMVLIYIGIAVGVALKWVAVQAFFGKSVEH